MHIGVLPPCVCVRVSERLEQELQTVVNCLWCWELNPGPLGSRLNLLAISPARDDPFRFSP